MSGWAREGERRGRGGGGGTQRQGRGDEQIRLVDEEPCRALHGPAWPLFARQTVFCCALAAHWPPTAPTERSRKPSCSQSLARQQSRSHRRGAYIQQHRRQYNNLCLLLFSGLASSSLATQRITRTPQTPCPTSGVRLPRPQYRTSTPLDANDSPKRAVHSTLQQVAPMYSDPTQKQQCSQIQHTACLVQASVTSTLHSCTCPYQIRAIAHSTDVNATGD